MNTSVVLTRWLRDTSRAQLLWTLLGLATAAAAAACLYVIGTDNTWQAWANSEAKLLLSGASTAITAPETTLIVWLCALALVLMGIVQGAAALAADEQRGYLEITLAQAVSRSHLVTARLVGLTLRFTALFVLIWAAVAVGSSLHTLPHSLLGYTALVVGAWLLVLFHAYLAFTVGAATGRVWPGIFLAAMVAIIGVATTSHGSLLASWLPELSPFQWALSPHHLLTGFDIPGIASLACACLLAASLAWVFFARRPLRCR